MWKYRYTVCGTAARLIFPNRSDLSDQLQKYKNQLQKCGNREIECAELVTAV